MQLDAITRVNQTRESLGRPPLRVTEELTLKAQALADHLALTGELEHSADLASGIAKPYSLLGENEGYGGSVEQNPRTSAIMIDPRFTETGIGISVAADGTVYEVQEYTAP